MLREVATANSIFFLGKHDNRASFRRFVSKRGKLRGVRQILLGDTASRYQSSGGAISKCDWPRLVEKQHINIARGLDGASGHGDDVALNQAVHPSNTNSGEEPTDGGRDQTHEQRDQNENVLRSSRIDGEGLK